MKSNSFSGYQNNLRVVYCQNRGSSKAKSSRYISKVPEKILDAPELLNDFCELLAHLCNIDYSYLIVTIQKS
jgi:hypothetical protein